MLTVSSKLLLLTKAYYLSRTFQESVRVLAAIRYKIRCCRWVGKVYVCLCVCVYIYIYISWVVTFLKIICLSLLVRILGCPCDSEVGLWFKVQLIIATILLRWLLIATAGFWTFPSRKSPYWLIFKLAQLLQIR